MVLVGQNHHNNPGPCRETLTKELKEAIDQVVPTAADRAELESAVLALLSQSAAPSNGTPGSSSSSVTGESAGTLQTPGVLHCITSLLKYCWCCCHVVWTLEFKAKALQESEQSKNQIKTFVENRGIKGKMNVAALKKNEVGRQIAVCQANMWAVFQHVQLAAGLVGAVADL